METKICKYCKEEKDTKDFRKGVVRKDGTMSVSCICKSCDNRRKYVNIKNNPEAYERFKERGRIRALKWNARNPDKARIKASNFYHNAAETLKFSRYIKNKYNIELEDYELRFKEQGGVCAICKNDKELHIDHSHETGKFRGLLCCQCNTALGKFGDNIEMLKSAIAYLENS